MAINVTKTYLPPFEEYTRQLKRAWDRGWITNNGELVQELEERLRDYLGVKYLLYCSNGTIALQMALKALHITGEVITTPFSYVATTTAILWENCQPVFADIREDDFCIDPDRIEERITPKTQAILATHVYGLPCDVERIQAIADRHNLRVIYDGAHAFGTSAGGRSILSQGDISACSFHATKLFHTVSGGCVITDDPSLARTLYLYRQFGHVYDDYFTIGTNAKNSEFHAAMGLCNLDHISEILASRREQWMYYAGNLTGPSLKTIRPANGISYNYAYFPVVFRSETELLAAVSRLHAAEIFPRRYFYPSLNRLPYVSGNACPVSESIANRILCLPLFVGLTAADQDRICRIIQEP